MKLFSAIRLWFSQRRECIWCDRRHYLGGNPFASRVSHGMCRKGERKFFVEPSTAGNNPGVSPRAQRVPVLLCAFLFFAAEQKMGIAAPPGDSVDRLNSGSGGTATSEQSTDAKRFAALSMLESNDDDQVVGSAGEVSRYQVKVSVWKQYCALDPHVAGVNPFTAGHVARAIMQDRCNAFAAIYRRQPTDFEWYVLWNRPAILLDGTRHLLSTERARAQRFANLCAK